MPVTFRMPAESLTVKVRVVAWGQFISFPLMVEVTAPVAVTSWPKVQVPYWVSVVALAANVPPSNSKAPRIQAVTPLAVVMIPPALIVTAPALAGL